MVGSDRTTGGEHASVVAVYETDEQARMGLDALREGGVPEDRITVVGAGEAAPEGAFESADSPTAKGAARGALFGGIAGALVTLAIPGGGVVLASGLFAAAVVGGGAGALAGASIGVLAEVGVPTANVKDYEEDLTDGRYLLVVHGSSAESTDAYAVLDMTDTEELDLYV
jgi:hypothetical protein